MTVCEAKCLCKSVTIKAELKSEEVSVCHCTMCRRWGGGPYLSVDCEPDTAVTPADLVVRYDSSQWAERGFCSKCGTHLFYRVMDTNLYAIPVGLFGSQAPFKLKEQIFIDHKPEYYEFANDTCNLTEAEVFAKYAPSS